MSGLLWWISRLVWMVKSYNSFTSSFSSTLLRECSYQLSLHSTPYSSHNSHCMTRSTTSFYILSAWGKYTKYCAQFHRDYHTFCIWMIYFGFRFWLLRRFFLVPDLNLRQKETLLSSSLVHQFLSTSRKDQIGPLSLS